MGEMMLDALAGGGQGAPAPAAPAPSQSADALLDTAISSLSAYLDATDSDDVDTATAASCLAKLQTIKANDQKAHESAMGTKPEHKALAKAAQGIAAESYGG